MATLDAEELTKLPDSAFAYIDAKGNRSLPIHDAAHVRAAMSRFDQTQFESDAAEKAARGKIVKAAMKFGVKLASFADDPVTTTAEFGETATSDSGYVLRTGKLFACGEYPDKDFSFDADDLTHAVESFAPVAVDLEHVDTVLQGKLGTVRRVWADGEALMGEVALPAWLDAVLDEGSRKVSATWDRATKTLQGLALVRTPRVSDAALMAAFSAAHPDEAATFAPPRKNTKSGQAALQRMHDLAVSNGARCKTVPMASYHESQAMQRIHDEAVSHGATCDTLEPTTPPSTTPFTTAHRSPRMKFSDWLTGKAREEGIEIDDAELQAAFASTAQVETMKAELAARDAQLAEMKATQERQAAEFSRVAGERRHAEAVAFANTQVAAHKITPAAAEALVPLLDRIGAIDATATFAEGESRTADLVAAFVVALPDLSLFTTEQVTPNATAALFSQMKTPGADGKEAASKAIQERLLKATPEGRAILAARPSN